MIIPHMIAKINPETLWAGICAKSQSFSNIPFLFSMYPKKKGIMKTTISIIIEPAIMRRLLNGLIHISLQLSFNDDVVSITAINLTFTKVVIE